MGFLIILIPLAVYILAAFSVPKKLLQSPGDYFTADRKVSGTAFSSSSIAYAFQVSTIYPFFLWSASQIYFIPLVNTIGWGIGILLFLWAFKKWKSFIGKGMTMHGFMGESFGKNVRKVASYITIIGFTGFILAETYFGSKVLLSVIDNRNVFYLIIFGSILMIFVYITYGGQLSSIRTDQAQLIMSYLGIFGIILYLLYVIIQKQAPIAYELKIGLIFLICYIPILLFLRKGRFIRLSESNSSKARTFNLISNVIIILLLAGLIVISIIKLLANDPTLTRTKFINLEGFGIAGLLTLIILPLTFQFVDLTNWQRILSVNESQETGNSHKSIRKGLLVYAVESPFTWVIFIFFGLLVTAAFPSFTFQDLLIDFPKQLINSNILFENIIGYVFIISILSIMLSTIDAFIVGLIFTYAYDINKKTSAIMEHTDTNSMHQNYKLVTKAGKYFGLITASIAVILFIVFDKSVANGGEMFINLLLAFYSAQLSFFPLIFGKMFFKKRPSYRWAIASMISGSAVGIGLGVYSVIWNPAYGWYPIIACFVLSWTVYLTGMLMSPRINK